MMPSIFTSNKSFISYTVITICITLVMCLGCSSNKGEAAKNPLIIFAASSLKDTYTDIAFSFESMHPKSDIITNFSGSQKLMMQISHGAQVDIYASADLNQISQLQRSGTIDSDPILFASNKLSIIVNNRNIGKIERFNDLAGDNIKIVVAHSTVPIGRYTERLFTNLASQSITPKDDLRKLIYRNIVSYEDSVKSVVMKTVLGEADVGVVYSSDAQLEHVMDNTYTIDIPKDLNVTGTYYAVKGQREGNSDLQNKFLTFLQSDIAKSILQEYGFDTE